MIEMARQTAKRCKERREEQAGGPVERFDTAGRSRLRVLSGYGRFARRPSGRSTGKTFTGCFVGQSPINRSHCCEALKTRPLPAASRLISEQIGSYHFNQINGF